LWDHCAQLEALIKSNTAGSSILLNGQVPETYDVTGSTTNISNIAEYKWYQWLYFKDEIAQFPDDKFVLGRYLGPSEDVGPAMAVKILKGNGQIVIRMTFRGLTDIETGSEIEIKACAAYDQMITKLGDKMTADDYKNDPDIETLFHPSYSDEDAGDSPRMPDIDDYDVDSYDQYIGAKVTLPQGNSTASGKVKGRKKSHDGSVKGKAHSKPMLDSRTYTVEFPDGSELEYAANIIAESMWAQLDLDSNQYLLMYQVVGHRKNEGAVKKADQYVTAKNGRKSLRRTTKGWMLCVKWKDELTTWDLLANLKESNPVEVAEYAITRGIDDKPAFAWWVPYTMKK
jgi:hypothetical protein